MPILCRSVGRRGRWSKSALAWCRRVVLSSRIDEYGNTFWEVDGELHREGDLPGVNLTDDTGDRTGWATALKPGFEPIVLARKPVERTVASNAAAYGTGALHVDACRLPTTDSLGGGSNAKGRVMSTDGWTRPWMADAVAVAASASRSRASTARSEALGRWPANVVLDDQQADILDQQAPGASRFYYAAKPGTAERPRVDGVSHPSVKPLALMRWLIRLVTPAGGVVLDPFAGSGTTVEACLLESRRCIAIERDLSFLPLIEHRLTRQADLLRTESESA